MEHQKLGLLFNKAFAAAADACKSNDPARWWPTQAQTTVLSWAIALAWAEDQRLGRRQPWLCTTWGQPHSKKWKQRLLDTFGFRCPPRDMLAATGGGKRVYAKEHSLDLCLFPGKPAKSGKECALLTMESEVHSKHNVGESIGPENDYIWDYFKLLWIPSPRRLMVARVGTCRGASSSARRLKLRKSFEHVTSMYRGFVGDAELVVLIIAEPWKLRQETVAGIWTGKQFDWKSGFGWSA